MRKTGIVLSAVLSIGLAFVSCENEETPETRTYTLDANGLLTEAETVYLGTDTTNKVAFYFVQNIDIDQFVLNHSFSEFGLGEGFTYTNCTDKTTASFSNLSGITANGVKGNTYFIAYAGEFNPTPTEISFNDGKAYKAIECYVTNSTYAYLTMLNGDAICKKFEQGDWFKLTITGYSDDTETGKVDFYLANGTDIINSWQRVDLSRLGVVTSVRFTLSSSDNGEYGMNTPSYFCLDQFKVSE